MRASARFLLPVLLALATALPASAIPNWLPPNVNDSYGHKVDNLYFVIYWIVAFFFFLTEGLLLYCIIFFRRREGVKAKYMHGSNVAELAWTVIPALILIGIGVAQAGTWKEIRQTFPPEDDKNVIVVQTFPKQFEWGFRYPGTDGAFGTADDVYSGNLHVVPGRKVLVKLASSDVIHSLFIPHARVKLDAMPGMLGRTWFTVDWYPLWNLKDKKMEIVKEDGLKGKTIGISGSFGLSPDKEKQYQHYAFKTAPVDDAGEAKKGMFKFWYDLNAGATTVAVVKDGKLTTAPASEVTHVFHRFEIACAELCGNNHFTMRSNVIVDTPEMYELWLKDREAYTVRTGAPGTADRWHKYWDKAHPNWNKVIR